MKRVIALVFFIFSIGGCASGPVEQEEYVFCGLNPEGLSRIGYYCLDGPNR